MLQVVKKERKKNTQLVLKNIGDSTLLVSTLTWNRKPMIIDGSTFDTLIDWCWNNEQFPDTFFSQEYLKKNNLSCFFLTQRRLKPGEKWVDKLVIKTKKTDLVAQYRYLHFNDGNGLSPNDTDHGICSDTVSTLNIELGNHNP